MKILPPTLWVILLASIALLGLLGLGPELWPVSADATFTFPIGPALVGAGLFLGGVFMTMSAAGQFSAVKTNIDTYNDPDHLVTTGLFRFTRNPMYLRFLLTLIGAGLAANRLYGLAPAIVFFLVSNYHYIPFEEKAAAFIFGDDYDAYRRRVRRWI